MWNNQQISLATALLLKTLQLCGRFFAHTMTGLFKSQGSFSNQMKGNSKHSSDNSLSPLGGQNRDIGTTSQTLLPMVNLIASVMQASIAELRNLTLASLKSSGFLISIYCISCVFNCDDLLCSCLSISSSHISNLWNSYYIIHPFKK